MSEYDKVELEVRRGYEVVETITRKPFNPKGVWLVRYRGEEFALRYDTTTTNEYGSPVRDGYHIIIW